MFAPFHGCGVGDAEWIDPCSSRGSWKMVMTKIRAFFPRDCSNLSASFIRADISLEDAVNRREPSILPPDWGFEAKQLFVVDQ
jgi:hypothetical protein